MRPERDGPCLPGAPALSSRRGQALRYEAVHVCDSHSAGTRVILGEERRWHNPDLHLQRDSVPVVACTRVGDAHPCMHTGALGNDRDAICTYCCMVLTVNKPVDMGHAATNWKCGLGLHMEGVHFLCRFLVHFYLF